MLPQRMSKAYLSIGLDVAPEKSQIVMNESMARFDRQLVELSAFSPLPDIKSTYAQLEVLWGQYKSALVGQIPRRQNVAALIDLDAKVLELANKGVSQLTQASGKPLSRLVNMSGRQRMCPSGRQSFIWRKLGTHRSRRPTPKCRRREPNLRRRWTLWSRRQRPILRSNRNWNSLASSRCSSNWRLPTSPVPFAQPRTFFSPVKTFSALRKK